MNLIVEIENLIIPLIEKVGYDLKKVEIKQKGRAKELVITIDKPSHLKYRCGGKEGGVSVEDCAKVSRKIDPILEKADLIKSRYLLTVSSPGIK